MNKSRSEIQCCVDIALQAHQKGYKALAEDHRLVAALALNRHDWLEEIGITIAEAIEAVGATRIAIIGHVQRIAETYIDAMACEKNSGAEPAPRIAPFVSRSSH